MGPPLAMPDLLRVAAETLRQWPSKWEGRAADAPLAGPGYQSGRTVYELIRELEDAAFRLEREAHG